MLRCYCCDQQQQIKTLARSHDSRMKYRRFTAKPLGSKCWLFISETRERVYVLVRKTYFSRIYLYATCLKQVVCIREPAARRKIRVHKVRSTKVLPRSCKISSNALLPYGTDVRTYRPCAFNIMIAACGSACHRLRRIITAVSKITVVQVSDDVVIPPPTEAVTVLRAHVTDGNLARSLIFIVAARRSRT